MKYALVWGTSARHNPQNCGLSQHLEDEDVVQVVKKKVHKREIFPSTQTNDSSLYNINL